MVSEISGEDSIWAVSEQDLVRTDIPKWKGELAFSNTKFTEIIDLSRRQKIFRVFKYIGMTILALSVIFAFICSLSLLADALKLIGGRGLGKLHFYSQNPKFVHFNATTFSLF